MFPAWLQALLLGIVQGLTEFIPISSSGHLVLVPYLAGWEDRSLAFDVMLHLGTLGAVLLYFRGEITVILKGLLGIDRSEQGRVYRRVGLFIVPASIPIAVVGLLAADQVEEIFESPVAASAFLLLTATLLIAMERRRSARVAGVAVTTSPLPSADDAPVQPEESWTGSWRAGRSSTPSSADGARGSMGTADDAGFTLPTGVDDSDPAGRGLAHLTLRDAMLAGLLQCLAVLPGVSRSGSTIAGGVFAGLTREAATRFSFLLAIPALVGATALSLPDLAQPDSEPVIELVLGIAAAFVSGYAAVRYLVRLVSSERLTGFAYYCLAASAVGFVGYLMLGPPSTV